jgi:hypothetical protein
MYSIIWDRNKTGWVLVPLLLGAFLLRQGIAPLWNPGQDTTAEMPLPIALGEILPGFTNRSLAFIANTDQISDRWAFISHGGSGQFLFGSSEIALSSNGFEPTLSMQFIAANSGVSPVPGQQLPGKIHSYLGNDPGYWNEDQHTFAQLSYPQLYSGVDLSYVGLVDGLKGTFIISPGSDPDQIRWCYRGQSRLEIDAISGDLLIWGLPPGGDQEQVLLREGAPIAWQEIEGRQTAVDVNYVLLDQDGCPDTSTAMVGFALGDYRSEYPLIIDPELEYSTYLGGSNEEVALGIAIDADGNMYIAGVTLSSDFPLANPWQSELGESICTPYDIPCGDVFVSKLSADGSVLLYSTYLGGSAYDAAWYLTVDSDGNVYVAGETRSKNYPTVNPYQAVGGGTRDAFVTKLDSDGILVYSTYLAGSQSDVATGIALEPDRDIYVAGATYSEDFPTANPLQPLLAGSSDIFVTRLDSTGSNLIYSTYLGGKWQ